MQALTPRWVLNPFILTCIFSSKRRGEEAWKAGMALQTGSQKGRKTLWPHSCILGPSTAIQRKAKFIASEHGFWQGSFKHRAGWGGSAPSSGLLCQAQLGGNKRLDRDAVSGT